MAEFCITKAMHCDHQHHQRLLSPDLAPDLQSTAARRPTEGYMNQIQSRDGYFSGGSSGSKASMVRGGLQLRPGDDMVVEDGSSPKVCASCGQAVRGNAQHNCSSILGAAGLLSPVTAAGSPVRLPAVGTSPEVRLDDVDMVAGISAASLKARDFADDRRRPWSSTQDVRPLSRQAGSGAWTRLPHVPLRMEESRDDFVDIDNAVIMDDDIAEEFIAQFNCAIVGRLLGRRLPHQSVLDAELRRRWAKFGSFKVALFNSECFLCIFESSVVRDEILTSGPWFINGFILGLDAWSPKFHPGHLPEFTTPVWIRLPELPLMFWDLKNIGRIASIAGEPLWVDGVTSSLRHIEYARVCVKVDLTKPLPPGVWVRSKFPRFYQKIVYEGLPRAFSDRVDTDCPSKTLPQVAVPGQEHVAQVVGDEHTAAKRVEEPILTANGPPKDRGRRRLLRVARREARNEMESPRQA